MENHEITGSRDPSGPPEQSRKNTPLVIVFLCIYPYQTPMPLQQGRPLSQKEEKKKSKTGARTWQSTVGMANNLRQQLQKGYQADGKYKDMVTSLDEQARKDADRIRRALLRNKARKAIEQKDRGSGSSSPAMDETKPWCPSRWTFDRSSGGQTDSLTSCNECHRKEAITTASMVRNSASFAHSNMVLSAMEHVRAPGILGGADDVSATERVSWEGRISRGSPRIHPGRSGRCALCG